MASNKQLENKTPRFSIGRKIACLSILILIVPLVPASASAADAAACESSSRASAPSAGMALVNAIDLAENSRADLLVQLQGSAFVDQMDAMLEEDTHIGVMEVSAVRNLYLGTKDGRYDLDYEYRVYDGRQMTKPFVYALVERSIFDATYEVLSDVDNPNEILKSTMDLVKALPSPDLDALVDDVRDMLPDTPTYKEIMDEVNRRVASALATVAQARERVEDDVERILDAVVIDDLPEPSKLIKALIEYIVIDDPPSGPDLVAALVEDLPEPDTRDVMAQVQKLVKSLGSMEYGRTVEQLRESLSSDEAPDPGRLFEVQSDDATGPSPMQTRSAGRGSQSAIQEVVRQEIGGGIANSFLRSQIPVTDGVTPTLRSLIELEEKSKHKDYWFFWLEAEYLDENCRAIGLDLSEYVQFKDRYGKSDSQPAILDLPMSSLDEIAEKTSTVDVKAVSCWLKYGWYSGNKKGGGCKESTKGMAILYETY